MNIIKPYFEIETQFNPQDVLKHLEKAGRVCYKSEDRITEDSAGDFVKKIIANGHEAVIEHFSITVKIVCDRGVTHEIVRHRVASYSQESTRYCNYSKDKFANSITFIEPCFWNTDADGDLRKMEMWNKSMRDAESAYFELLEDGATPQEARSVLPNSLKTEILVTMNLREWRHFFRLRTAHAAHPQMREIAIPMLSRFREMLPEIFGDI